MVIACKTFPGLMQGGFWTKFTLITRNQEVYGQNSHQLQEIKRFLDKIHINYKKSGGFWTKFTSITRNQGVSGQNSHQLQEIRGFLDKMRRLF